MQPQTMTRAADGMIAGVIKGMADYFGWSPKRLRIAYVILTLGTAGFPGVVMYFCLWWVMPLAGAAGRA
ncbi:MAG: PspC domain-containing protein [Acidobacteriota bacterium]|nr:PspC domain-containing protein [Acidobacteriota bacterium]